MGALIRGKNEYCLNKNTSLKCEKSTRKMKNMIFISYWICDMVYGQFHTAAGMVLKCLNPTLRRHAVKKKNRKPDRKPDPGPTGNFYGWIRMSILICLHWFFSKIPNPVIRIMKTGNRIENRTPDHWEKFMSKWTSMSKEIYLHKIFFDRTNHVQTTANCHKKKKNNNNN